MELSPVLLLELRKAMAAAKKKKAISAAPSHTSAPALVHPGGAGGGVRTPFDSTQPNVCKRKAEKLSSHDCATEPATRRPAPGQSLKTGQRHRARRAN
jgi:hypothetical protein